MKHAKINSKRKAIKDYKTRSDKVKEIIEARNAQRGKGAKPTSRVWKDNENRKNKYIATLDTVRNCSLTIFENVDNNNNK